MRTIRYLLFGFSIIGWVNVFDSGKAIAQSDEMMPLIVDIHTAEKEDWMLGIEENTVAIIPRPNTEDSLQGGIFGNEPFYFDWIQFYWKILGKKIKLKAFIIFHNSKYGSLNNALFYPDGVVILRVPIYANGKKDNPKFDIFKEAIKQIIPIGSENMTSIRSGASFSWFRTFPRSATYKYIPSLYYYAETGQLYNCSTTYLFPMSKKGNYLSSKQFEDTFGLFNTGSGKQVDNTPFVIERLAKPKEGKRIVFMPIAGNVD